jgi:uncharacterized protein YbjT (DUF2867 family)
MKVLMTGATGRFAHLLLPELNKLKITVRALLRDKTRANTLKEQGVDEIAIGDLNNADSLIEAARGVNGIFHINPAFDPNEARQGIDMVKAATKTGVKKFVFSGVYHPSLSLINHSNKGPVETALYRSDLNFTILQPASFMQNLDAGWQAVLQTGKVILPYSVKSKISWVDYRDVAEIAAKAFADDDLSYGTFELCAEMADRMQVAALMSEALKRKVEAAEITFDEWVKQSHMPEGPMRNGLKAMFEEYGKYGFHGGNSLIAKTLLGREPRSLKDYINELATGTRRSHSGKIK